MCLPILRLQMKGMQRDQDELTDEFEAAVLENKRL
jgi:hypothetical protein